MSGVGGGIYRRLPRRPQPADAGSERWGLTTSETPEGAEDIIVAHRYIEAKRKPDSYLTEKGTPLWQDILHAPLPKGAGGQFNLPIPGTNGLMSYSKKQKAAKDFLRRVNSKEIYGQWFTSQQGYTCGATKDCEKDPVWSLDPVPAAVSGSSLQSPSGRVFGTARPCLGRGGHQVYHHRYVCEGGARPSGRGRRRIGPRGLRGCRVIDPGVQA